MPEPPPAVMQVPLMLKHPPDRLMPFANVEVAVVEETFSVPTLKPPLNVEVAKEELSTAPNSVPPESAK